MFQKNNLNTVKKSNFVKEDKTIVRSTHPPLETVLIDCKGTEVKAYPFKIADVDTHVLKIIEQNNFTKSFLHIIGQQLDRIEEKIVKKPTSSKPKKPLIDLPSKKKLSLKTSQSKTIEKVEQMLSDLKIKTEQNTSTSTAYAISRKEKEIVFDESTDSDSSSSTSNKTDLELPKVKRFVGKPNPMSFSKKWYSKPTPLDMQFEESFFKPNFLFLLINFMNGILMVYLNKKLLIKWVICLRLLMPI